MLPVAVARCLRFECKAKLAAREQQFMERLVANLAAHVEDCLPELNSYMRYDLRRANNRLQGVCMPFRRKGPCFTRQRASA